MPARASIAALRKVSLLLACAALAQAAGSVAHAQEVAADQTAGFQAFARYCLNATGWKDGPGPQLLEASDISEDERRAVVSTGGAYRFYLLQDDPRVLLALQWEEREMTSMRVGRGGSNERRPVLAVGGRCVVYSHENRWDGMAEALERLTGVKPRDASSPDSGLDAFIMIDTDRMSDAAKELRPWSFTTSRADGTTMYRAIM